MNNVIDTEIVDIKESSSKKQVSSIVPATVNQAINRNKELLNKGLKASEDELKQLAIIQANINLANQKKQELVGMHYLNYIEDVTYQNSIISIHNSCLSYANLRGIQFWKSYDNSNIFYRVNEFNKQKKLNAEKDLFSLLDAHIKIYDSIEEVQFSNDNTLILIASYLSIVKNDIFDPLNSLEWLIFNNMKYKNTFEYTSFLQRRSMLIEKQQLEQQLQSQYYQSPQYTPQSMNIVPTEPQTIPLLHPFESAQNKFILPLLSSQDKLQELSQQLEMQPSIIQDFIYHLTKNEDYFKYLMNWLASFFQTLNKTGMALVLLGDKETTDTLINNIIRPLFAFKKEYFSVTNDETLKKTTEIVTKDKIFYHIDEISTIYVRDKRTSKLVREILKTNTTDIIQAVENNDTYIHGELIITSSNESPYPFLKDTYSRCSIFKVSNLKTIMKALGVSDYYDFEEKIKADLGNFSNILVQYQTEQKYYVIYDTPEKKVLPRMKKGILLTPILETQIQRFMDAIKEKKKQYFKPLELEDDKNLYKELVANFDNDDAIYQPLLSEYFNIIHEDIIFLDNSDFIDILKEKECLFNQTPDDKFKANGHKRYKLYKYKLAKNYKGNCKDTI